MPKFLIDKQFSLCYGHRTWTQKLIEGYAEENFCLSCRRMHGHEGLVHLFMESETLNAQQMVTDFRNTAWFKKFLDDVLDHKFILDMNDPLANVMMNGTLDVENKMFTSNIVTASMPLVEVKIEGVERFIGYTLDISQVDTLNGEFYESFVLVDFCPTSENLCRFMHEITSQKMAKIGVKVSRVDWFETPKSRASYGG